MVKQIRVMSYEKNNGFFEYRHFLEYNFVEAILKH